MHNATKEFNLEFAQRMVHQNYKFGIWDGSVWYWKHDGSWWNNLKFLYKYGLRNGPLQAQNIAKNMASQFFQVYDQLRAGSTWTNLRDEVETLVFDESTQRSCRDYYRERGISDLYIDQVLGGFVRNIYLANVDKLHAWACSVSLYAVSFDTFSVKGGNYQIFEKMLANAKVETGTMVRKIEQMGDAVQVESRKDGKTINEIYDQVVMAAPIADSQIEFSGYNTSAWNTVNYTKLYVTVVSGRVNPEYFDCETEMDIPAAIFTTAGRETPFNSFGIQKTINATHSISKIFSAQELSNDLLSKMYLEQSLVFRHAWNQPGSYPDMNPRTNWDIPVRQGSLWYLNSFEPFISTMETSGISAMNAAIQLANAL